MPPSSIQGIFKFRLQKYKFFQKDKLKKNILKTPLEFKGLVFAIASAQHDYRLCYFINKSLDIELKKASRSQAKFSFYKFEDLKNNRTLYFLRNIQEGKPLVPEYKKMDYLFAIRGAFSPAIRIQLLEQLRKISVIQAVVTLSPEIFHKKKIYFD